jgi:choline dehydrogenase-like flavoprotein
MTVATRLSEDIDVTVLLLEAGPIDEDEAWVRIPFFTGQGVGSTYDWNLMTVPQTSLDGRARSIPQGRALGGGTIINAMLWNRGGAGDYDDWAILGSPGWGWSDMLPYFIKARTKNPDHGCR